MEPATGLNQALKRVLAAMPRSPAIELPLAKSQGHVLYQDVVSCLDLPPFPVATRDGYALCDADLGACSASNPKTLSCTGTIAAGSDHSACLSAGNTVRVCTGGRLPPGTAAVVAEEHVRRTGNTVRLAMQVLPGTNILYQGNEIARQETVARTGDLVTPGLAGLLAASGTDRIKVYRPPQILIIATGDELSLPGGLLKPGKIFASNPAMIQGWLDKSNISSAVELAPDDLRSIKAILRSAVRQAEAIITIGGSWKSERDLILHALSGLDWQPVFNHLRLVPGKSASMGLLDSKPVFVLPGPPSACMAAFTALALPGLKLMAGHKAPFQTSVKARLTATIAGRQHWSRVIFGRYQTDDRDNYFTPLKGKSRLRDLAAANACITVAENVTQIVPNTVVDACLL